MITTKYSELQIGHKIRKIRESKNINRKQIASDLDISERGYADLENEKTNITLLRLYKICEIFVCGLFFVINFSEKDMIKLYQEKIKESNHSFDLNREINKLEELMRKKYQQIELIKFKIDMLKS
jgi:transcriptional regulator with XRE-family HTH domain